MTDEQKEKIIRFRSMGRGYADIGKVFTAYGNKKRKYCVHKCYIADRFGGGGNA